MKSAPIEPLADPQLQLLMTPSAAGHSPFINAIHDAHHSVHMVMFHLTDKDVVAELEAATKRNLDVKVIVDGASVAAGGYKTMFDEMQSEGVDIIASSAAFSITHEKAMVIDGETAFITAMNMTNTFGTTRDFGVVTKDAAIVAEWESVFEADLENAQNDTKLTPTLSDAALIWSPVDSASKLVALIHKAKKTLIATTESINSPTIVSALEAAAKRGVDVRLIAPACDQNKKPLLNYDALGDLNAANVQANVMPYPATETQPYMHSKMIVIDGKTAFVGSINLTNDSTLDARELGVVFSNEDAVSTIASTFEDDWAQSTTPPDTLPTNCPVVD